MADENVADYHYEVKFTLEGYTRSDDNGSIARHVKRSLELVVKNYMEALPKKRTIIEIEITDLMEEVK